MKVPVFQTGANIRPPYESTPMNGPQIVCVGCGEPTRGINAICDRCMTPPGESGPPVTRCEWCERGYAKDRWGLHTTKTGGYIGKCLLPPTPTSAEEHK